MKRQDETPRYATLLYSVRKELGISITEYFYLDMIYHLSHNEKGYCYKSLDSIATDMGISNIGVMKIRDRLTDKGLLIVKRGNKVRTSEKYNKVIRSGDTTYNKVNKTYNKVISEVKQSYTKNNNRITIEKEINKEKDFRGLHSPNKEKIRYMLKQKGLLKI